MDIPGEYLQKSDLIYCLAQTLASGSKFWWFPGHAGLFLGTRDANSTINNGYTIIESSPWNVHFSNMDDFKTSNDHLYMGARRYDFHK